MPATQCEIPALPVLLPLTTVVAVATLCWLHHRGALTPATAIAALVACGYGAGVLDAVLFPFQVATGLQGNDVAWWVYVQPVPLLTADRTGLVLNAALFVPLGLLLPLLTRVRSGGRVALVAFVVSLGIEVTQLVGDITVSTGRVFDVDDLIANTAGAVVGFALYRASTALRPVARVVRATARGA